MVPILLVLIGESCIFVVFLFCYFIKAISELCHTGIQLRYVRSCGSVFETTRHPS
ncbi:hypothetical protein M434DRAFT_401302 [Hypoxylon sp. CO27-5]|nr:hypothetical protein M434DRAFT_401302 [Hypoxylon sp. CO27-5]